MNNISIFRDTLKMCRINDILAKSVEESVKGTRFYAADDYPALPGAKREGRVILTPERTFEAAFSLAEKFPNSRIGVLNFASAVNPGGGVKLGANAQEECLCRCSTLYPCLDTDELMKSYYIKKPPENESSLFGRLHIYAGCDCVQVRRKKPRTSSRGQVDQD